MGQLVQEVQRLQRILTGLKFMGKILPNSRIALYLLWGCASFLMIITGRHLKCFPKIRLVLHSVCGTLIFGLTILFAQFATFQKAGAREVSNQLAHEAFGTGTYYLSGFSWGSGILVSIVLMIFFFIPGVNRFYFWIYKAVWYLHRFIGYFTIIWSMWAILSGLFSYNFSMKYLIILHFAGYIFCFIVLEVIHCI